MDAMQNRIVGLFGWMLLATCAGCNRQDTEAISRIGSKIAVHTQRHIEDINPKLDLHWPDSKKTTLQDIIQDRLRHENTLTDVVFEVIVKDKEVELRGNVKDPLQRQRAVELAETVAGVEKVNNAIQVIESEK